MSLTSACCSTLIVYMTLLNHCYCITVKPDQPPATVELKPSNDLGVDKVIFGILEEVEKPTGGIATTLTRILSIVVKVLDLNLAELAKGSNHLFRTNLGLVAAIFEEVGLLVLRIPMTSTGFLGKLPAFLGGKFWLRINEKQRYCYVANEHFAAYKGLQNAGACSMEQVDKLVVWLQNGLDGLHGWLEKAGDALYKVENNANYGVVHTLIVPVVSHIFGQPLEIIFTPIKIMFEFGIGTLKAIPEGIVCLLGAGRDLIGGTISDISRNVMCQLRDGSVQETSSS